MDIRSRELAMPFETLKKAFSGIATNGDAYVTKEDGDSFTVGVQAFGCNEVVYIARVESSDGLACDVKWLIKKHRGQSDNESFASEVHARDAIYSVAAGIDIDS